MVRTAISGHIDRTSFHGVSLFHFSRGLLLSLSLLSLALLAVFVLLCEFTCK